jgi:hypothetical protein
MRCAGAATSGPEKRFAAQTDASVLRRGTLGEAGPLAVAVCGERQAGGEGGAFLSTPSPTAKE